LNVLQQNLLQELKNQRSFIPYNVDVI